ncbi:hypothetical protein [Pyxidicoccus xibeiensis]|uniref:hypothetical protein n=1 Tax=Pyxidicoccus xibeiensis TaxID=2906759 RepID=UPI0020A78923|nr:hypothetical protein [Pyxidicoccus xibeiensis]MCP3142112.1 hypothetical protein [Pyxidicoccus xibeiensis]
MTSIKNRPGVLQSLVAPKPPEQAKAALPKSRRQAVSDGFERPTRAQVPVEGEARATQASLLANSTEQLLRLSPGGTGVVAQALAAQGTGSTGTLSEAEQQEGYEILSYNDPEKLDAWLAAHPDPAKRAAMMEYLYQFPEAMGALLSEPMSEEAKANIGGALGHAFAAGKVTAEQIATSAEYTWDSTVYGEVIGQSHNPRLITTFVDGVMASTGHGDDGRDPIRAQAAAFALAGLPPAGLDTYLNTHGDTVHDILSIMNGNSEGRTQEALGALLSSAAKIRHGVRTGSVSDGLINLFMEAVPLLGENPASVQGATEFFMAHGDAMLRNPKFSDETGFLTPAAEKTLSEFWARTMFQGSDYENKDEFTQWVSEWLGDMTSDLSAVPRGQEATDGDRADAVRLGSIVGTLETGFETAIERLDQRNEAITGMVDLVFQLKDLIPGMKFPGADQAVDVTVDVVRDWVVGMLTDDPASPNAAVPFHDQFAFDLDNQDLRESYAIGRGETHDNDHVGIR